MPPNTLQRDESRQSITSVTSEDTPDSKSAIGVNDLYDAMSRVKERFSSMLVGQKSTSSLGPNLKEDCFVTIGIEYR